MPHIVILNGSPRAGGNTDLLMEAFAEGASDGCTLDVIKVRDMNVSPCDGCNACFKLPNNRCRMDDDMADIYERLRKADALVIATPVYFYGASAQLKAVIDRLHNPIRKGFSIRKLVLLSVAAQEDPSVFDPIVMQFRAILDFFGLEDGGMILAGGVRGPGDMAGRAELDEARELGRSFHRLGRPWMSRLD